MDILFGQIYPLALRRAALRGTGQTDSLSPAFADA